MNTTNKVMVGMAGCALFLTLAVLGVSVSLKVETKPETANASTVSMMLINGARSATVTPGQKVTVTWQAPAGYSYCNTGVSPVMPHGWNQPGDSSVSGHNIATSGSYTITVWNRMRFQMQCAVNAPGPMVIEDGVAANVTSAPAVACSSNSQCGSDGFTGAAFCQGNSVYKNYKTYTCNNAGTSTSSCSNVTVAQLQQTCASNQTCSAGACVTNPVPPPVISAACDSNDDCGVSQFVGGPFCQGNGAYQNYTQYTCNNPGTANATCSTSTTIKLKQACSANQLCNNGTCTNSTPVAACNANADCGTNGFTGGLFCMGNGSYQNYITYTCTNPGAANASCSSVQAPQLKQACGSTQACNNGSCAGTGTVTSCTSTPYQQCIGNAIYYINSCTGQQSFGFSCGPNQTCSGNSCINTYVPPIYIPPVINYGNLTATVQVRNLSSGNLTWANSVAAAPSDIVQFNVTVQATGNTTASNIMVKDTLPSNLVYNNFLTIDGASNSGNITAGVNIGSLSANQTRTLTYQVQVAGTQNFSFGTTTLSNSVSATGSNSSYAVGSASVAVTRSGVLGATTVSTGLTNNPFIDSFFIPALLALLGVWAYKSGILNNLAFAGWIGSRKAAIKTAAADKALEAKISEIRNKESA